MQTLGSVVAHTAPPMPMSKDGSSSTTFSTGTIQVSAHLNIPQYPPRSSHTYVSEAHGTLTTIDHILCPKHLLPLIGQCHPLDEDPLNTLDHLHLICHINLHLQPHSPPKVTPTSHPKPNWKKVTTQEIRETYTKAVESALGSIPLPALNVLANI